MALSVSSPIEQAFSRTADILFRPFDLAKWLAIGLCAFMAYLIEGSPGGQVSFMQVGAPPGPPNEVIDWFRDNLGWAIGSAVCFGLGSIAVMALLMWLQSRGKFMLIDNIAYNRGQIVAPWSVYREVGNSLFLFTFIVHLIIVAVVIGAIALCVAIAWPDIQAEQFGNAALAALILGGVLFVLIGVGTALLLFALEHFVVPAMYLRMEKVGPSWRIAWREIIAPHAGPVALFVLMRIVIAVVIGMISFAAVCLTCFIAAIPYVGTVILLPLFVFSRSYTLCFLEQIGPEWQVFQYDRDAGRQTCPACGYDLTGLPASGRCPECGQPYGHPKPPGDGRTPPTVPEP